MLRKCVLILLPKLEAIRWVDSMLELLGTKYVSLSLKFNRKFVKRSSSNNINI